MKKMALIEYIEPASAGDLFIGIGGLAVLLVMAYCIYRLFIKIIQFMDVFYNREAKYEILEEVFLDKVGKSKGIDLDKELIRKKMIIERSPKTFRKRINEKILEEMFGKENEDKKKDK